MPDRTAGEQNYVEWQERLLSITPIRRGEPECPLAWRRLQAEHEQYLLDILRNNLREHADNERETTAGNPEGEFSGEGASLSLAELGRLPGGPGARLP